MAEFPVGEFGIRVPNLAMKKGDKVNGHDHNFGHLSIVTCGVVEAVKRKPLRGADGNSIIIDGVPQEVEVVRRIIKADSIFPGVYIEADHWHEFTCIEGPARVMCVFFWRDPATGEVVQEYNGWEPAWESK